MCAMIFYANRLPRTYRFVISRSSVRIRLPALLISVYPLITYEIADR
jgi:hypothetical protein